MGAGASRDEMVYHAVQRNNVNGIKQLRREGAHLEYRDHKGRTPLMLACSRRDTYEAAQVLLQLGADVSAYAGGPDGGTAIHYAARKMLDRTVLLLLNNNADALQPNDMGRSALDLAREYNCAPIVRMIENRVGLFCGNMRQQQLADSTILKLLVPQWVFKNAYVAVVPTSRRPNSELHLAIYASANHAIPNTVVALRHCKLYLAKLGTPTPLCIVEVQQTGEKFKFAADSDTNEQLAVQRVQALLNACKGLRDGSPMPSSPSSASSRVSGAPAPPQRSLSGSSPRTSLRSPSTTSSSSAGPAAPAAPAASVAAAGAAAGIAAAALASRSTGGRGPPTPAAAGTPKTARQQQEEEDIALRMAIEESIRTAEAAGVPLSPTTLAHSRRRGGSADLNGWAPEPQAGGPGGGGVVPVNMSQPAYGGWADPPQVSAGTPQQPPQGLQAASPAAARGSGRSDWESTAAGSGAYGGWGDDPLSSARPYPAAAAAASVAAAASAATGTAAASAGQQAGQPGAPSAAVPPVAPQVQPSAPPMPAHPGTESVGGPIAYPTVDSSPITLQYNVGMRAVLGGASGPGGAAAASTPVPATAPMGASGPPPAYPAPAPPLLEQQQPPPPVMHFAAASPLAEQAVQVNPAYDEQRVRAELARAASTVPSQNSQALTGAHGGGGAGKSAGGSGGSGGGGQCTICWDAPPEAVLVPCGHLAGCMECMTELKRAGMDCPVCRAKIDTVIRVYHV